MGKALTSLKVTKLRQPGRYPDGDGLYLQIGPTRAKAWLLRFQLAGKERFMGLGSVKAFTLKEARERARRSRQLLADGIDPIEHRLASRDLGIKEARERVIFKQAAEQFLAVHEAGWRNDKHRAQWRSSLDLCLPHSRRASGRCHRPGLNQLCRVVDLGDDARDGQTDARPDRTDLPMGERRHAAANPKWEGEEQP